MKKAYETLRGRGAAFRPVLDYVICLSKYQCRQVAANLKEPRYAG